MSAVGDDISTSPVRESSFLKLLNQASSPRTNPFGLGSDRTPQGLESAKKRLAMGAALFPSATEAPRESPDVSTGDFQATWDSVGQLADTYAEKKTPSSAGAATARGALDEAAKKLAALDFNFKLSPVRGEAFFEQLPSADKLPGDEWNITSNNPTFASPLPQDPKFGTAPTHPESTTPVHASPSSGRSGSTRTTPRSGARSLPGSAQKQVAQEFPRSFRVEGPEPVAPPTETSGSWTQRQKSLQTALQLQLGPLSPAAVAPQVTKPEKAARSGGVLRMLVVIVLALLSGALVAGLSQSSPPQMGTLPQIRMPVVNAPSVQRPVTKPASVPVAANVQSTPQAKPTQTPAPKFKPVQNPVAVQTAAPAQQALPKAVPTHPTLAQIKPILESTASALPAWLSTAVQQAQQYVVGREQYVAAAGAATLCGVAAAIALMRAAPAAAAATGALTPRAPAAPTASPATEGRVTRGRATKAVEEPVEEAPSRGRSASRPRKGTKAAAKAPKTAARKGATTTATRTSRRLVSEAAEEAAGPRSARRWKRTD